MSIEISNVVHAMALVTVDKLANPLFVGQGNVGFAPFGHGPDASERLGLGRYRLHMLAPLSILTPTAITGRGEGIIIASPLQPGSVSATVAGLSDILVETTTSSGSLSQAGVNAFAEVQSDTTTTSGDFVDLLTLPITVAQNGTGNLEILATASAEGTFATREVQFRLTVDGVALGPGDANGATFTVSQPPVIPAIVASADVRAADVTPDATANVVKGSVSIFKRAAVVPGDHTIKLQWRATGTGASASILVSAGIEHGSLRVTERGSSQTGGGGDDDIIFQVLVLRFPQQSSSTT